ncbi:hypothetical protein Tco_0958727 [Tanacetum coccineum]
MRSGRVLLPDLPEGYLGRSEIAHMTVGEVTTRVTELAELYEHDTRKLFALLDGCQDYRLSWMVEGSSIASRKAWAHSIGLSQRTLLELRLFNHR